MEYGASNTVDQPVVWGAKRGVFRDAIWRAVSTRVYSPIDWVMICMVRWRVHLHPISFSSSLSRVCVSWLFCRFPSQRDPGSCQWYQSDSEIARRCRWDLSLFYGSGLCESVETKKKGRFSASKGLFPALQKVEKGPPMGESGGGRVGKEGWKWCIFKGKTY